MNCSLVQLKCQMSNLHICHVFSLPECEAGSLATDTVCCSWNEKTQLSVGFILELKKLYK